jgi:hypothetical protein
MMARTASKTMMIRLARKAAMRYEWFHAGDPVNEFDAADERGPNECVAIKRLSPACSPRRSEVSHKKIW